jgi:hypothetical protein
MGMHGMNVKQTLAVGWVVVREFPSSVTEVPMTKVPTTEVQMVEVPRTEVTMTDVPTEAQMTNDPTIDQLTEVQMAEVSMTEVPTEDQMADVPTTEDQLTDVQMAEIPTTSVQMTEVPMADVQMTEVPMTDVQMAEVPMPGAPGRAEFPSRRLARERVDCPQCGKDLTIATLAWSHRCKRTDAVTVQTKLDGMRTRAVYSFQARAPKPVLKRLKQTGLHSHGSN